MAVVLLAAIGHSARAEQIDGVKVLSDAGVQRGIIVQLGCGDVQRCLDLHNRGKYVVQAIDSDSGKVAAARKKIQSQGSCGVVSARVLSGARLPYLDNLVNLLIADDSLGVSEQEMLRVVRPLGAVLIRKGDAWRKVTKPWPEGMDEWSHFLRDATGNAVSSDKNIAPPRRLQWSASPLWGRSHETNNSVAALVTAGGRMFSIFDYGLTGMEDPRLGQKWALVARDAFNGTVLWRRPLKTWGLDAWKTRALRFFGGSMARRLVADRDRVYVTLDYGGAVRILDAGTGKILGGIPNTRGAMEILVSSGQVIVACRQAQAKGKAPIAIVCYDIAAKKVLWQARDGGLASQTITAGPAEVVYCNNKGMTCLDRSDGAVRWKHPAKAAGGRRGSGRMLVLVDGKAVMSSRGSIVAVSLAGGKLVWKAPGARGQSMRAQDLFYAQGAIWCSGDQGAVVGYDVKTGKEVKRVDASSVQSDGHHLRCYRAKASEDYLITQFRGVEFVSLTGKPHTQQDWLRGTCTYGVMPANGVLYVPPHSCLCFPAALLKGMNALAGESKSERAELARESSIGSIEKGPAFGSIAPKARPDNKSWPGYRHDAMRSGATANNISGSLKRKWKIALKTDLTAPVAANGRVYVAARNLHTIYALDAADGKVAWTFSSDARIDSAPSIYRGLLLFGGADGFLYCVRASDGKLAWRRRLAPLERWMAADGQLESVWRLHGSVVIVGNLAYCLAGRSTYLNGGLFLYAVDIETGQVKHRGRVDTASNTRVDAVDKPFVPAYHIEGGNSDLLVAQGGFIYLHQMKFSPDLKLQPTAYLNKAQLTRRPSINLDNKPYVNEDIFKVSWRGKTYSNYDKLAGLLVDEKTGVGEHALGMHLFTTSGFLDSTFFNRTFWMYSKTWPGFNHANLAPKSGQLVVVGPKNTYALKAYTSRYPLSPRLNPQTKGYLLIADDNNNEPTLDPRAWAKDKGMGFSRGAEPLWHQWLPVRARAMVLAGKTLVVCGPPDVVKDGDPMAAFEGRMGTELWTISADDGKTIAKLKLSESPIFDGMIVADDRLYLCTENGEIICMSAQ
jgi:outer membrane protein assembly factor BamB